MPVLSIKDLKISFHSRNGIIRAVNNVSFDLFPGEMLGIIGESGSGKSVTCHALLGLLPKPPAVIDHGQAIFKGANLLNLSNQELRKIRGKEISIIFQNPMSALNPYLRIVDQLAEPLILHERISLKLAMPRLIQSLDEVGIPNPETRIFDYPHQFSGGMLQRIMIAMALITKPKILIADEPTTALDVTIQKQILDLIKARCSELGTAAIFISHDLSVVSELCDRVGVMYAGQLIELAPTADLFRNPQHPYTKALRDSIPSLTGQRQQLYSIKGSPPNPLNRAEGCPFAPRCEYVIQQCRFEKNELRDVNKTHQTACIRHKELSLTREVM